KTLDLLSVAQTPPLRVLTTSLINELDDLCKAQAHDAPAAHGDRPSSCLILALDDYHTIADPAIHEVLSALVEHLPRGVHLALATRADPQLPLAGWRARWELNEVRSADLRFTSEEAHALLEATTGRALMPETTRLLESKTEGWVVGLRLAALSMRTRSDYEAFMQSFKGTDSDLVVDYLVSEVLARQSAEIQDFVLRTSLLDRFCAPLCEAVTEIPADKSQEILDWIGGANLFVVPLGKGGGWYRYHHLFRDLLRHELSKQASAADISELHARAGAWFAQKGLIDEALHHFSTAGDTSAAVALVARHRYALMNRAQWPRLERYLQQFSPELVDQSPDLLMKKTWLLYQRGRYAELPAAVQKVEATLARTTLPPEMIEPLQGEISTLRSYVSAMTLDVKSAMVHARHALAQIPHELWIVRILARLCLSVALLMKGDVNGAYEAVYAGFEEEGYQSNAFKATLLTSACNIHWMTADLPGLARAAEQVLALSREPYSPAFRAWGHYHLGRVRYHHGDLAAAGEHFAAVVRQPYLSYGICYVNSACGLALTHQAQGRPEEAREVVETAVALMLETGNTTLLPVALAFQAELALMQGKIAAAGQQVARFDPVPPLSPMFGLSSPHLTLVKVWLAQDTPASLDRAAELLSQVRAFCESTHTSRFLIEALALQALLHDAEGDEPAALASLEQAITLAEPGGFIRLFVDLGPSMARLLDLIRHQGLAADHINQILAVFETTDSAVAGAGGQGAKTQALYLVESLTPRELEVLELLGRHLTNKEIAAELVISPDTVKSHTVSIYRKLDVRRRQQAVARARELGLLSSNMV
ncbi:MAG TPA: LuxR C-terminal-related transcriptional regulator, partial [Anaerolineae bacterium]|nr:LuxR C-terminal-related transcriptional regulator [Anaerolineae bacterium]